MKINTDITVTQENWIFAIKRIEQMALSGMITTSEREKMHIQINDEARSNGWYDQENEYCKMTRKPCTHCKQDCKHMAGSYGELFYS